jgi:DNA-binding ferritin-like protein (Dps family)
MTKKDFELIANAVKELTEDYYSRDKEITAELFARVLATTNPRFDRARFITACGVK